jgi:hypothetical protein
LHRHRAWADLVKVVRLVPVVLVRLVPAAPVALVVLVARVARVRLAPVAQVVQVLAAHVRLVPAALRVALQVLLVRVAGQALVAVAVLAAEPLGPSVGAAARVTVPVSRSARNAKSMNRDKRRALVARSFHAETALP